jgi:DNA mismatch repair ATPase MutL
MLFTSGGIGFNTGVFYNDPLCFNSSNYCSSTIYLLHFAATLKELTILLNEVTTAEINNDYFPIERSVDGVDFNSIIKVNRIGNSTQKFSYITVNHRPLNRRAYYPLKQTDYNEQTSYSRFLAERFKKLNDHNLTVYVNPFSVKTIFHAAEYLTAQS